MNAQSNRPLTKFAGSERGGAALSVVLNKKPVMHVNSIQSKDMIDGQRLTDEPVVLSTFTVDSTGFYNVSFQFALQNKSKDAKGLPVHFYDFGICKSDCTDSGNTLKNIPISAKIVSDNTLIDSLCAIVEIEVDCQYYAWVDVSSTNNNMLEFIPSKSHVRLYAL